VTEKIATRSSWKNQAMPEERARLAFSRTFTAEELARIERGLVPEQMEDKWFVFWEAPWLWFHRSWTGLAIYGAKIEDGRITLAVVNRHPEQYRAIDDVYDAELLDFLIERLLLDHEVPFPHRETVPTSKADLLVHHVVGRAKPNE
jgi:hypothetical protein